MGPQYCKNYRVKFSTTRSWCHRMVTVTTVVVLRCCGQEDQVAVDDIYEVLLAAVLQKLQGKILDDAVVVPPDGNGNNGSGLTVLWAGGSSGCRRYLRGSSCRSI